MWSPYASNYDNPIRYSDPLGDEGQDCCQWLTDAIDWVADKTKQAVQYTGGLVIGTTIAIYDNVTNSNIRSELAPTFAGTGAAGHGWNAGLNTGDGASLLIGVTEMGVGTGMAGTGGATLVASGGTTAPVSVPLVVEGTALTAHGYMTTNNATQNLLSQNGRVDASGNNPYGSKGKPDHQQKVDELAKKAQSEAKPGEAVLRERKVQGHNSNRRPDAQIVDPNGQTRKIFEAERKPNSQRKNTKI